MTEERRILTQDSYQLRQIWEKMTTGGDRQMGEEDIGGLGSSVNSDPVSAFDAPAAASNHNVADTSPSSSSSNAAAAASRVGDVLLFQNIRNRLRTFTSCCTGRDVIRWLLVNDVVSARTQALAIGQALVDARYLERVSSVDETAAASAVGLGFFSEDDLFKRGKAGRQTLYLDGGADGGEATSMSLRTVAATAAALVATAETAAAETRSIGGRAVDAVAGISPLRGRNAGEGTVVG